MRREEFIKELTDVLAGSVTQEELYDSISFYREYYAEQIANGKTEEEVSASLGSPRLIAHSIIDAHGIEDGQYVDAEDENGTYTRTYHKSKSFHNDYNTDYYEESREVYNDQEEGHDLAKRSILQKVKTAALIVGGLVVIGVAARVLFVPACVVLTVLAIRRIITGPRR